MMAISFIRRKALILGLLALGIDGLAVSAEEPAHQCVSAECACEEALLKSTVESLEEFLRKYQHDAGSKETACAAFGVIPDGERVDDKNANDEPAIARSKEVLPSD